MSTLIIGGGIAGIQAALDLAEMGVQVYLVDRNPSIGGIMAKLDKTFPTLDCAPCILTPKMASVLRYPNIKLLMYSEVQEVSGTAGNFKVKVLRKPTYVDWNKCTGCGVCAEKCPYKVPDEYNMKLGERRAIYIMFPQAVPRKAVIDAEHCVRLNPPPELKEKAKGRPLCGVCERICPAKAINYDDKPEVIELEVSSIIIATGGELYDASKIAQYGYGKYQNVYLHLEFERLVSATGPTGGKIIRRSDKKEPRRIAWIQCVGSRDVNFNYYCSTFCCMASTKQAILAREHMPEVETTIFYMDMRAFGKGFNEFVERAKEEFKIRYVRGRVAEIEEDPKTKNLILHYEDTTTGRLKREEFDMVVLALALRPNIPEIKGLKLERDRGGFIKAVDPIEPVKTNIDGVYVIGIAGEAKDIPDSVAEASMAAIKAAQLALAKRGR